MVRSEAAHPTKRRKPRKSLGFGRRELRCPRTRPRAILRASRGMGRRHVLGACDMYKKILLAYDGSDAGQKALLDCREVAQWSQSELHLVAVMPSAMSF